MLVSTSITFPSSFLNTRRSSHEQRDSLAHEKRSVEMYSTLFSQMPKRCRGRKRRLDWFARLFGFTEAAHTYEEIQNLLVVNGTTITSKKNNKSYQIGNFKREQLGAQRARIMKKKGLQQILGKKHSLTLEIKVGDVGKLHMMPSNRHATFQVICLLAHPINSPSMLNYDYYCRSPPSSIAWNSWAPTSHQKME